MNKRWGKMSKRVLTVILSVSMAMSNMTVMASEINPQTVVTESTTNEVNTEEGTNETNTSEEVEAEETESEDAESEKNNENLNDNLNEDSEKADTDEMTEEAKETETILDEEVALAELEEEIELADESEIMTLSEESAEEKKVVNSTVNAFFMDAAALLATVDGAVNGLQLKGDGWTTGTDSTGVTEFGYGDYAKAGKTKPTPNEGSIPTAGAYIEYTATEDGTFTICEKTQKGKTFYVVDSEGNKVDSRTAGATSSYDTLKYDVEAGKTYYAYMSAATAYVFSCEFTPTIKIRSWSAEALLNATEEADNGLQLKGNKWTAGTDSAGATEFGSESYAKAAGDKPTPNGGAIPTNGDYIEYTASENGTLIICEKTQKNKSFYVVDNDGNIVDTKKAGTTSSYDTIKVEVEEGKTYYAYMSAATANVFCVKFQTGKKTVTPWENVATPSINNVTVDSDGNLTVDYSVIIDEYKGADKATIIMYYEGYEASSKTIEKSDAAVVFSPLWSGDYTFTITSERNNEADKTSEVYTYENYVLPVKKPIVEVAQNRGAGKVYLDWINVDTADYYIVSYKEDSAEEYTVADYNNTKGYATVENLAAGSVYDFNIKAVRTKDNFVATYDFDDFTVTSEAQNIWSFATIGSAQETHAVVADKDGNVLQSVDMSTKDEVTDKQAITVVNTAVANTDNTVTFKSTGNGKISDSEEGFQYFYTHIDPNTQNFKLTATFELKELFSDTFDNQTGFGIIATDMLGVNYYGTDGLWIKCKYLNSVSTQIFSSKANFVGQRNISGYTSCLTSKNEDMTRTTEQQKFTSVKPSYTVGTKYTFVLEKTNSGYVSSVINEAGEVESVTYDDLGILSVQEDGSATIGVFAARNAGVEVSDIKFETSDSTGVTSAEKNVAKTPSAAVLSSSTVGTDTYEYIYVPNVDGNLLVCVNGEKVYGEDVKANEAAKVQVPVKLGSNKVDSYFVPDKSQNLTSTKALEKSTTVTYQVLAEGREFVYVSADGKADAAGTAKNPVDIYTAVKFAAPGQTIILKDGTYNAGDVKIERSVSGTSEKPITLVAENTGKVIFEGIGLNIIGSYWNVYGIYVHYSKSVGIQISGNYNVIEMCTVEGAGNTGIQISKAGSVERETGFKALLWPSYNLVKNCESFDNCDAGRNDADGFAAKLTCGEGNVFYGCIGHNNVDDGWDLFAKPISGSIGAVTIENCIAYNNGWLTYEDTTAAGYEYGEGNGFKLGGSDMYGGHILKNSISFGNIGKGITSNSCPDCKIYNCISYGNAVGKDSAYNVGLTTKASNLQKWVVEGLISVTSTEYSKTEDQIPKALKSVTNFIYNGSVSKNNAAIEVKDSWFENVDLSIVPTRNADGTIDMHGLLVVTEACPSNTGARLDTTSADAKSVNPLTGKTIPAESTGATTTPAATNTNTTTTTTTTSNSSNNDSNNSSSSESSTTESTPVQIPTAVIVNSSASQANGMSSISSLVVDLKGGKLLQAGFINRIKAQKLYMVSSVSKNVGISIYGGTLTQTVTDIDLDCELTEIKDFANGFVTKKLTVKKETSLGYGVGIHLNVGAEYVGKTAFLFKKNLKTGMVESAGIMKVNAIGNVMVSTTDISDIYVLISK